MNKAILLIGGNMGNRLTYIESAKTLLLKQTRIEAESSIWESEAWGFSTKDLFLNQVIVVKTALNSIELLNEIQNIENTLGRKRKEEQWISRIIDIDILFFNSEIIETAQLKIPHPQIQNRRFTLEPLNEIAPNLIHPVLQIEVKEILNQCTDQGKVWILKN